jgi:hypothetical protein
MLNRKFSVFESSDVATGVARASASVVGSFDDDHIRTVLSGRYCRHGSRTA